jgi:hypothetical protein
VPLKVTKAVVRLYADNPSRTDFIEVDGRGHSLTMDAGWGDVAALAMDWIEERETELVVAPGSAA